MQQCLVRRDLRGLFRATDRASGQQQSEHDQQRPKLDRHPWSRHRAKLTHAVPRRLTRCARSGRPRSTGHWTPSGRSARCEGCCSPLSASRRRPCSPRPRPRGRKRTCERLGGGDQGGFDQSRFHIDASAVPLARTRSEPSTSGSPRRSFLESRAFGGRQRGHHRLHGHRELHEPQIPIAGLIRVVDGGASTSTPDSFDWAYEHGVPPTPLPGPDSCSAFPGPFPPAFEQVEVTTGQITVVDATPQPTSKGQCKNGGWKSYGFKSQGRCIAFATRMGASGTVSTRALTGRAADARPCARPARHTRGT